MDSSSRRCAACKHLRRRCGADCVLSPYFPANDKHNLLRFSRVHKIFGASNVARMLMEIEDQYRSDAAECIAMEALFREQYPIHGSTGIISVYLQHISTIERELAVTQAQIVEMGINRLSGSAHLDMSSDDNEINAQQQNFVGSFQYPDIF